MSSPARLGTLLMMATLVAGPGSAAEPAKQLQGKLSWSLHRIASASEEGASLSGFSRRLVDPERRLVRAVAVLSPGGTFDAVATAVESAGGSVVAFARGPGWAEVEVPAGALRPLSRLPAVRRLRAPFRPVRHVESQGVASIKADAYRSRTGADGTGVRVAILDSGWEGARDLLGGELPASTELTDFVSRGEGDDDPHGAACAEIVHDVAPGAQLLLAGFGSETTWIAVVEELLERDVQVISHSIGFINIFPPDGRNPFAAVVDELASQGILFVTAAGNAAESLFQGTATDADANGFVEFGPRTELLPISLSEDDSTVILRWDDPYETSDHDFDLFAVTGEFADNPALEDNPAILGSSRDVQNGEGDPLEILELELEERRELFAVVYRDPASPSRPGQRLFLWSAGKVGETFRTPAGSISPPADARGALAVGAVRFDATTVEGFSSRGPTSDGRAKPDLGGPDGVETLSYDDAFFGTSSAAPHVAGAAALLLSANPGLTPTDLRLMLEQSTASGGRTTGKRNDLGYGVLDLSRTPAGGPNLAPDRIVLGQAPFEGLEPFGDGETGPVAYFEFSTTRPGDIDIVADWGSAGNDVDVALFIGGCDITALGEGPCPGLPGARTAFKPETIVIREAPVGPYTLVLFNLGASPEAGVVTVGLTPGVASAATTGGVVEPGIARGYRRR